MKTKLLIVCVSVMLLAVGCASNERVVVAPATEPCPLPQGYKLEGAIVAAEKSLNTCPDKLDLVFAALIDIGKHQPKPENGVMIQGMMKRLVSKNIVSEKYSKNLYQKYFSYSFVSLPDTKAYNLPAEIDDIKDDLRAELAYKQVGLVECCGDKEGYMKVEAEYARLVMFLEDLVLNREYVSRSHG